MPKLINAELYHRLCDVFGKENVKVNKPGKKGTFDYKRGVPGDYNKITLSRGAESGEEFAVNCIRCGDRRQRLYFNHQWGTKNPYDGTRILWCCHCYNEECQSDPEYRQELADLILGDNRARIKTAEVEIPSEESRPVEWPGEMRPLQDLARHQPNHIAIRWCHGRGYDPRELGEVYGVKYCARAKSSYYLRIQGRIVAPFYKVKDGKPYLAGWTARRIEGNQKDRKWLHGSKTGNIVYGLNLAASYLTTFIVEGCGDAWAVGPHAAALLGKTINATKLQMISAQFRRRPSKRRRVIVMLDPEQPKTERLKGREHHLKKATRQLQEVLDVPVIPCYLPEFTDPGELNRQVIWWHAKLAAKKLGYRLYTEKLNPKELKHEPETVSA